MDKEDTKSGTTDRTLMLQKVFEYVSRYFVIIAGSLSGTGGLFTAVGFLAERSHLAMLGVTFIPVNLDQYLYTGAKFFVILPILVVTTIIDNLNIFKINVFGSWWATGIGVIFIFFAWHFLLRIKRIQSAKKKFENIGKKIEQKIKNFTYQYLSGLLFLFMIVLFIGVVQMFLALGITNLLFDTKFPYYNGAVFSNTDKLTDSIVQREGRFEITQQSLKELESEGLDKSILKKLNNIKDKPYFTEELFLIVAKGTGGIKNEIIEFDSLITKAAYQSKENLMQYIGKLFALVSISGLILWLFISLVRKHNSIEPNMWHNLWLGLSILLFFTQIILLPANYGVLLLSNEFPEVAVSRKEPSNDKTNSEKLESEWPEDNRLILLYQESDTFYLYSNAKVWYVSGKDISSMIYVGKSNVFVF
jgi:hypothetical protein